MSVPYGAPAQQPGGAHAPLGNLNLAQLIGFGVTGLALVSYFCGFATEAGMVGTPLYVLLVGGLLASLPVLPKAPATLPFGALFSVVGALWLLQLVVSSPGSVPSIVVVMLIASILQALAAVAALLADAGVLKVQPKPAHPYGQPGGWNPQSGGFPQSGPQQFGGPMGQPGQPGGPGQPGVPGQQQFGQQAPQPTSFMPQPGQFSQPAQPQQPGQPQPGQPQPGQPQPGQYGQQQGPGTPHSGFEQPQG